VASEPAQPVFYYDLGNPACYVAAERIMAALGPVGGIPEWEPIHALSLGLAPLAPPDPEALAKTIAGYGLQPLRLPVAWPPDSAFAMRVATYAKGGGRAVAFSLAAFRQVFAGGRDLGDEGTVLIAAAACEMHPTAVLKGAGLRSVGASLERAGERAQRAGVTALPAIEVAGCTFCGEGALAQATEALAGAQDSALLVTHHGDDD
jgi:2-hydroxychromene-2-carboxylate isomerase